MSTGIQWTDETWNPVTGCTKVSQGCKRCYAATVHGNRHGANVRAAQTFSGLMEAEGSERRIRSDERWSEWADRVGAPAEGWAVRARALGVKLPCPAQYDVPFETVLLHPGRLSIPLHWVKPRKVFVNSMSDLFHADVPDAFIADVFGVMRLAKRHTFQVLTKRPERMRALLSDPDFWASVAMSMAWQRPTLAAAVEGILFQPPLPNVWLGVSVEDQRAADSRIPELLATPAAVRFLSCEPLLGPVDLSGLTGCGMCGNAMRWYKDGERGLASPWIKGRKNPHWVHAGNGPGVRHCDKRLDWVIAGAESGTGARPADLAWFRGLRDQCRAAGVSFFMKQVGSRPWDASVEGWPAGTRWGHTFGTRSVDLPGRVAIALRNRHGGDMGEWPEDLRMREFPGAAVGS